MKYNIIITAGGTSEKIDNVRKITNSGSGRLGCMIANKLIEMQEERIHKIYYVCAKDSFKPKHSKIEIIEIVDTKDLQNTITRLLINNTIHFFIHSMAVSDYTVDYVTTAEKLAENIEKHKEENILDVICHYPFGLKENKISSSEEHLMIKLKKTPKIISMIKTISPKTYLVGFKLLDQVSKETLINTALRLKEKNHCDLVVANDLESIREGKHQAFIIKTKEEYIKACGKEEIARMLIKEMIQNDGV